MKYLLAAMFVLLFSSCLDDSTKNIVLKDKMIQFVPKDSGTNYFYYETVGSTNNILEDLASEVLFNLKEPVLNVDSSEGEFVRFIWLRAFENAVVIRVNKFNDTVYIIIKELKTKATAAKFPNIIKDTIIILDKNKWEQFTNPIKQSNFFNSSYTDTSFGLDGAVWFLECRLNNKYKVIKRWDNGYLSSNKINSYLNPLIDFTNKIIPLKSVR